MDYSNPYRNVPGHPLKDIQYPSWATNLRKRAANFILEIDNGEAKARILDTSNNQETLLKTPDGTPLEMDIILPKKNMYFTRMDQNNNPLDDATGTVGSIQVFPGRQKTWDPMACLIGLFNTRGAKDKKGRDVGSTYNNGSTVTDDVMKQPGSALHGWDERDQPLASALKNQKNGTTGISNDCFRAVDNKMAFWFACVLKAHQSRIRVVHNRFKAMLDKTKASGKKLGDIILRSNPYRPYENTFQLKGDNSAPTLFTLPKWDKNRLITWLKKKFSLQDKQKLVLNDAALEKATKSKSNETLTVGEIIQE